MNVLNRKVLILNQSYEYMQVMLVKDAMCKLSDPESTLEVVKWCDDDVQIHSAKSAWPVPSVMKLNYYVPLRKKRNAALSKRTRIYQRDKYKCQYCGTKVGKPHPVYRRKMTLDDLTLDHIVPRAQNGKTTPNNLVTACQDCNSKKKDRTPEQADMPLLISKTLLNVDLDMVSRVAISRTNPEWKRYLHLSNGDGDERYSHKGDVQFDDL